MISGNKEVIATLETYLEIAKKNPIGHVAIVMTGNNLGIAESSGSNLLQEATRGGLNRILEEMDKSIDIYALPEENENLDASYVCYNAVVGPHSYEFINWLVDAEMTRIREEAEGPLKVGFWQGKGNKLKPGQEGYSWLNDIFRPALKFVNAIEDEKALYGKHKKLYGVRDIFYYSKNFLEEVPRLIPPFIWPVSGYVTITIKKYYNEWVRFADYLQELGNRVIFICDEEIDGFKTYSNIDILTKLSIYERAKCNLFDDSQLNILALFGSRPWLQFKGSGTDFMSNPIVWESVNGFPPGEQYSWTNDNQRIVWDKLIYENFVKAWEEYI